MRLFVMIRVASIDLKTLEYFRSAGSRRNGQSAVHVRHLTTARKPECTAASAAGHLLVVPAARCAERRARHARRFRISGASGRCFRRAGGSIGDSGLRRVSRGPLGALGGRHVERSGAGGPQSAHSVHTPPAARARGPLHAAALPERRRRKRTVLHSRIVRLEGGQLS